MRISAENFVRIRKVSINASHPEHGLNYPIPAILQGSHTLEHTIPSKRLGAGRSSGRFKETAAHYCVEADGVWEHHEVHRRESREQTGTGP